MTEAQLLYQKLTEYSYNLLFLPQIKLFSNWLELQGKINSQQIKVRSSLIINPITSKSSYVKIIVLISLFAQYHLNFAEHSFICCGVCNFMVSNEHGLN